MRNDRPLNFKGRKNRPFSVISSWIGPFAGIKNIKFNEILDVAYSTFFDNHDKL